METEECASDRPVSELELKGVGRAKGGGRVVCWRKDPSLQVSSSSVRGSSAAVLPGRGPRSMQVGAGLVPRYQEEALGVVTTDGSERDLVSRTTGSAD